jgi:hypothetical protein
MKKLLIALVAFGVFTIPPAVAGAACTLKGVIVRITAAPDGGEHKVYFRTSSLFGPQYTAASSDTKILIGATTALMSQMPVTMYGSAPTCPPSGGSIGGITRLNLNP